ncbi:AI-2E family transporter [Streptomyces tateyamensis]|uniref:AI-2E family transporter n=2 Tax=Streptomyces tateyamensis TaxID=565073 RepID=A0A2V4NLJ0_9ACTN|nr:AI-2E family transporter [Streptomyces tateyamensis]
MLPPVARAAVAWAVVVVLAITVGSLVVYALVALRAATVPLVIALLGTALLHPVMPWLVRCGLRRGTAAALTCVVLVAAVGTVIAVLTNSLVHTAPQIARSLQEAGTKLAGWLGPTGDRIHQSLTTAAGSGSSVGGSLFTDLASGVLSGLGIAVELITGGVLALALVFFFLRDGDRTADLVRSVLPAERAELVVACGQQAFAAMAGFMRGTTLIALIDALFITVGLVILGVPGAAGLGALVFLGAFIPFIGAFLSGTVAVLVALADGGLTKALWTLGVVLAVQAIEGNVLQPVIQSRTVELHPATIMFAVVAGSGVAGMVGALLAVPVCAAALGIVSVLRGRRLGEPAPAGD